MNRVHHRRVRQTEIPVIPHLKIPEVRQIPPAELLRMLHRPVKVKLRMNHLTPPLRIKHPTALLRINHLTMPPVPVIA